MIVERIPAILHDTCHHQRGFAAGPLFPWIVSHPSVSVSVDPSTYPSGSQCHLIKYNRPACNDKYDDRTVVKETYMQVLRKIEIILHVRKLRKMKKDYG